MNNKKLCALTALYAGSGSEVAGAVSSEIGMEESSDAEVEPGVVEKTAETITVDGVEYYLLYTYNCENGISLLDEKFSRYFENGDNTAGLYAITNAGNVYVNGVRIPYITESGEVSAVSMVVNDKKCIWQVDGGWAWKTHLTRQWDDKYNMPYLEGEDDYVPGQPLSLGDAAFKYTEYLTIYGGQTLEFYAEVGSEYVSLLKTTMLTSALVGSMETIDGVTTFYSPIGEEIIEINEENADSAIETGDMMIYWNGGESGWVCRRAVSYVGVLIENTDPNNGKAMKEPYFQVGEADEVVTTGDSQIGKNFGEQYRHTQFIRGHRRTDQYNYDGKLIMWCTNESRNTVIGFTRADSAYGALEHAVAYAEEVTAGIVVSEDGTDVATDTYWVTRETWDGFSERLEAAKALLEDETATSNDYDAMILKLSNVLGGTEDLVVESVMKANPLGVVGTMALGTMVS